MGHVRSARARGPVYQGSRSGRNTSANGEIVTLVQGKYKMAVSVSIAVLKITAKQSKQINYLFSES